MIFGFVLLSLLYTVGSINGASAEINFTAYVSNTLFIQYFIDVTMNCQANSFFDYNCHQCICDAKGNYAICSGKECPRWFNFKEGNLSINLYYIIIIGNKKYIYIFFRCSQGHRREMQPRNDFCKWLQRLYMW